jgi:hypothetical protein
LLKIVAFGPSNSCSRIQCKSCDIDGCKYAVPEKTGSHVDPTNPWCVSGTVDGCMHCCLYEL